MENRKSFSVIVILIIIISILCTILVIKEKNRGNDIKEENKIVNISCWGDSYTYGDGGNGVDYTKIVKELAGDKVNINNFGVPSETSIAIASRQGGIPIYVSAFTIPATTEGVQIQIKDPNGDNVRLTVNGEQGLNPCYINGIKGKIIYDRATSIHTFTRIEPGKETFVRNNTQIITDGMINHRDDLMIICAGANNYPKEISELQKSIIDPINNMIKYSKNSKYIIIGLIDKFEQENISDVNKRLEQEYGYHFLDIRTYLIENGINDMGIQPTQEDVENIQQGRIPPSLQAKDRFHLNNLGYTIIGQQVYKKLISLGYITN